MKSIIICIGIAVLMVASFAMPTHAQKAKLYTKNNVLVGANFNDGPGSSDMTLIMQLSGDGKVFMDEGSPCKYIHNPDNEKVVGWTEAKFDDKKWKDGISGFGFSDNDDNTVTPAGLISIWTRYYFDASNASSVKELILLVDYDDQYIAWLNGVEIARSASAPGSKGDIPAWNASQGGIANRGSAELPAGKPNKARWVNAAIEKKVVDFGFGGASPLAVEVTDKLTTTWGSIKTQY